VECSPHVAISLAETFVADDSSTLIVMGGCHARLQEVVLGGVAHATLAPITVPVFMSH
jgi:nucleotide-binding universal stress UspA family protein